MLKIYLYKVLKGTLQVIILIIEITDYTVEQHNWVKINPVREKKLN